MIEKVLIIIPCYNEEAALPGLLTDILSLAMPNQYMLKVVVINDCSKDNTRHIPPMYGVNMLDLPINLGIGGAIQTGMLYAEENDYDLAVQIDGDGQHPPKEVVKILEHYKASGANVVIGSRFIENDGFQSSFTRRLGISYFHWLNRLFTGKHIYDSTSGFRLFDRRAIKICARFYPDEYPEPESLVLFSKYNLTIAEVPVVMMERQGGQSSIRNFASLYYCIKVTIAMIFSTIRKLA